MTKREFMQKLLGLGAATATLPAPATRTAVIQAPYGCPDCGRQLAVLVALGSPREEPCVTYVGSYVQQRHGAFVTCACGTRVWCAPWKLAAPPSLSV